MKPVFLALSILVVSTIGAAALSPEQNPEYRIEPYGKVYHAGRYHKISYKKRYHKYVKRRSSGVSTSCLPTVLKRQLSDVRKIAGNVRVVSAYRPGATFGGGYRSAHADCRAMDLVVPKNKRAAVLSYLMKNRQGCVITHCRGCGPIPEHIHVDNRSDYCGTHYSGTGFVDKWTGRKIAGAETTCKIASLDINYTPIVAEKAEFVSVGPLKVTKPLPLTPSSKEEIFQRDDDYNYLCTVYNRQPTKRDRSGDFTWKDIKAAALRKMGLCEYAIGGMSVQLRKSLAKLGRKLDEKGIRWSILSGFRDNYRQKIASGFKAGACGSWHGGTCKTKGYGDGRAVDVTLVGNNEDNPKEAGDIFARYASAYGLVRPMPGIDPAHIQLAHMSSGHRWAHKKKRRYYAAR